MQRGIQASTAITAPARLAQDVLRDDPGAVLGDGCTAEERRQRAFRTTLTVDAGGGTSVVQEVVVDVGRPRALPDRLVLPLAWEAVGHQRLLPGFGGALVAFRSGDGTELRLQGTYTVPLGVVGRFGDAVAGRRLARSSVSGFLDGIARRLEARTRLLAPVPPRSAEAPPVDEPAVADPCPVVTCEEPCSELYIG